MSCRAPPQRLDRLNVLEHIGGLVVPLRHFLRGDVALPLELRRQLRESLHRLRLCGRELLTTK
eukprot:COSAG03_NODE_1097_length_4823_cov_21.972693_2_plen_63_part_00